MKCLERRERESEKEAVLSSEKKALEKFAREKDSTFLCTRSWSEAKDINNTNNGEFDPGSG